MADRETIEKNKIKKNIRDTKAQGRKAKRKRNLKLAILCTIFSIIVILGAAYVIIHCISNKENLRDAGIAAFNEGNYAEAISDFDASLSETQWFSAKMDDDTRLYLAASYMRSDKYDDALTIYKELEEKKTSVIDKESLKTYISLANALSACKEQNINETYIGYLQKEYDRGNTSMALFLGACYQMQGKYEEMETYYNAYKEKYGINTYIAYQLSTYYLNEEKLDLASSMVSQGLNASDDLYMDKVLYNDVIISEKNHDYENALSKITSLKDKYPNDEVYKREYDFLYSRINMNTEPVHTEGDAEETY